MLSSLSPPPGDHALQTYFQNCSLQTCQRTTNPAQTTQTNAYCAHASSQIAENENDGNWWTQTGWKRFSSWLRFIPYSKQNLFMQMLKIPERSGDRHTCNCQSPTLTVTNVTNLIHTGKLCCSRGWLSVATANVCKLDLLNWCWGLGNAVWYQTGV